LISSAAAPTTLCRLERERRPNAGCRCGTAPGVGRQSGADRPREGPVNDYSAYRAAGQAVAGLSRGIPLEHAAADGIETTWLAMETDDHIIAAAAWLAGMAAVNAYRFGQPPPPVPGTVVHEQFNDGQNEDLAKSKMLLERFVEADEAYIDAVLFDGWQRAQDFSRENWPAIEAVALAIQGQGRMDFAQIKEIAERAGWATEPEEARNHD